MHLFGGVYDPFRQGFDCKIPSGSLKVIYGAGEMAQLSEARLATKLFMCILWNLALNLAWLKFNQRRDSKELGFWVLQGTWCLGGGPARQLQRLCISEWFVGRLSKTHVWPGCLRHLSGIATFFLMSHWVLPELRESEMGVYHLESLHHPSLGGPAQHPPCYRSPTWAPGRADFT